MSTLGRRIGRLEGPRHRPSPFDVMDPVLAELSTPDLIALVLRNTAPRDGRYPTAAQDVVYAAFRERLASAGLVLP